MSRTVIQVENLSKQYRLGQVGTGTLTHDINRWWHKVRGKDDPYRQIGETNDRTRKGESDYVWALKDINFDVKEGEVLGIIGRNGAGKSTLLKILSRTTAPTSGKVKMKGRVASLLEVGTGFHPELSGRENIYLNGAILGMTRGEITRKFDEIVDFAGVERYIDTPVKRYSSGMYVRLAFAVAAFLEPEILIIDEVLAVGDLDFQKKCLGRVKDVSETEGRSVLFVSHDMQAMARLVNTCIWMKDGKVNSVGGKEVVSDYISYTTANKSLEYYNKKLLQKPHIKSIKLRTTNLNNIQVCGEKFIIELTYCLPYDIKNACITLRIKDNRNINCFDFSFFDSDNRNSKAGQYTVVWEFENLRLYMGKYTIDTFFAEPPGGDFFERINDVCPFEVTMFDKLRGEWDWKPYDAVYLENYTVGVEKQF